MHHAVRVCCSTSPRSLLMCCLHIGLILQGSDCRAQNLIFNPSFETDGGTPESADGWELFGQGGDVLRLTENPNTGDAHIRLTGDPLAGANFAVLVQRELPVEPSNDYELELFARGDPVDGQVGYRTEFYNEFGGIIGGMFDNNVFIDSELTTDYQRFSTVFTAPESAATGVVVVFWELLNSLTTVDVDDVGFMLSGDPGLPADFNGDGSVDLLDLDILGANFGGPGDSTTGDANGDGLVDLLDLDILGASFGTMATQAVPEPAAAVLALIAASSVVRRRRLI